MELVSGDLLPGFQQRRRPKRPRRAVAKRHAFPAHHGAQRDNPGHQVIDAVEVDWLTFTSSSTARNFYRMLDARQTRKLETAKKQSGLHARFCLQWY